MGSRANVLTIGKEAQKRGAVHGHFVLGCESALELQAARAFRRHLERLSSHRRCEFGHVNGKFVKPKNAREVAAYLSSYFVRGRGYGNRKLTPRLALPTRSTVRLAMTLWCCVAQYKALSRTST
jgi:hypothetical protein